MMEEASPPVISLDDRLPGHAGNLTVDETNSLKQTWAKLLELFSQQGIKHTSVETKKESAKSGGFFGFWAKVEQPNIFFGTTTDPQWLSLPFEKALPLIPGQLLERTFWNMVATDNPDSCVLRYLRARNWNVDEAYKMLANTLRWRLVQRVDDIVSLGETGLQLELNRLNSGMGDIFIEQLRSGKATLGGPDKEGRGICFVNAQLHYKDKQPFEVVQLMTLYLMETSRLFCGYPMTTACIVFNLENFSLANMDYEFVKFILHCLESYYPETLGLCIIHNAPRLFSMVWSVVSEWLDPVVSQKIRFTHGLDEFSQYIDIRSTPVIISGNPEILTKDEQSECNPPKPGSLTDKDSIPEVQQYHELIRVYEDATLSWSKLILNKVDNEDAIERLEIGRDYRRVRIIAEKALRGPTSFHEKGVITLTSDNRLVVDFGGENWIRQDITERV